MSCGIVGKNTDLLGLSLMVCCFSQGHSSYGATLRCYCSVSALSNVCFAVWWNSKFIMAHWPPSGRPAGLAWHPGGSGTGEQPWTPVPQIPLPLVVQWPNVTRDEDPERGSRRPGELRTQHTFDRFLLRKLYLSNRHMVVQFHLLSQLWFQSETCDPDVCHSVSSDNTRAKPSIRSLIITSHGWSSTSLVTRCVCVCVCVCARVRVCCMYSCPLKVRKHISCEWVTHWKGTSCTMYNFKADRKL